MDEQTFSGPLPSHERLTLLACLTGRNKPSEAVKHALAVWREAHRLLAEENEAAEQRSLQGVPLPETFPATLDDFLARVVKGPTKAKRLERLRQFLQEQSGPDDLYTVGSETESTASGNEHKVTRMIQTYKENGISREEWRDRTRAYLTWWKYRKSASARRAASKRTSTKSKSR